MMKEILFILTIIVFTATNCDADTTDTGPAQTIDTVLFQNEGILDSTSPVSSPANFEKNLNQNPTLALFKSMLIPGWGQIGNKKYVKAGIFAALDVWFISSAIHYGQQASDFREMYQNATELSTRNELYSSFLDRKDQRNKFTWFAVIVSFISMFDAYVDAHLSGYPKQQKNDDVSWDIKPYGSGGIQAKVVWKF